jgi:hypothetical protein
MKYLKNYNESLTDKMVSKPLEDIMKYDNFKKILRSIIKDKNIINNTKDLNILIYQLPILLDSKIEDLEYFVIKHDLFTGDDKGNMIMVKPYIDALLQYIGNDTPEIIEIPTLTSGLIEKIKIFKNKKISIIDATHGTMVVINKNILH